MSEMVERLARELCALRAKAGGVGFSANGCPMTWQQHVDIAWPLHEHEARTMIVAMREPTEAMVTAGRRIEDDHTRDATAARFTAMIDAALK